MYGVVMSRNTMERIDQIEFLAEQLDSLRVAEDLALEAQPELLSQIRNLYDSTLDKLIKESKIFLSVK